MDSTGEGSRPVGVVVVTVPLEVVAMLFVGNDIVFMVEATSSMMASTSLSMEAMVTASPEMVIWSKEVDMVLRLEFKL